jgi:hypothetical protein
MNEISPSFAPDKSGLAKYFKMLRYSRLGNPQLIRKGIHAQHGIAVLPPAPGEKLENLYPRRIGYRLEFF